MREGDRDSTNIQNRYCGGFTHLNKNKIDEFE
jgi:hypothetical protein